MKLPFYIAHRLFTADDDRHKVSRPAIRIATIGVAIGLAVMIITVSVVLGFKHTIRDKVAGFGNHIQVENFMALQTTDPYPICISDSLIRALRSIDGIKRVQRFAVTQGILKTDADFLGVALKGIGSDYDPTFLKQHIVSGEMPAFSEQKSTNQILMSKRIADKLQLKAGDRIYAYFITGEDVRARRFTISGIYETNMSQFDQNICLIDLYTAVKLN